MTDNHDFNLERERDTDLQTSLPWEGNSVPALKYRPKNKKQGDQKLLSWGSWKKKDLEEKQECFSKQYIEATVKISRISRRQSQGKQTV